MHACMHIWMCVCMYRAFIFACVCMHAYIHMHTCMCMCVYVHMHVHAYVCMCVCIFMCVCACVHVFVHVSVCMSLCVHACACVCARVCVLQCSAVQWLAFLILHLCRGGEIFIMITTTLYCGTIGKCLKTIMLRVHPSHVREIRKMETIWKPVGGWASTMSQIIMSEGMSVPVLFNCWSH